MKPEEMQSLAIQQKMSENADMSRSANQLASNILLNRKKKEDTHFDQVVQPGIRTSKELQNLLAPDFVLGNQTDAISPLAQQAVNTGGMLNYQPQDILGMPTDRPDESGLADTSGQEFVNLPQGTDVEILVELIKEKAPVTRQRF